MKYTDFKNKYNGKIVDYDKYYGGQCWDIIQQYFTESLAVPESVLGGAGLVSNMLIEPKLSQLLTYFNRVPGAEMYPGDIVIWSVGHAAIFDHWDGQNCWYFSQNHYGTADNPKGGAETVILNMNGLNAFRKKDDKIVPPKEESTTEYYTIPNYNQNTWADQSSIVDGLKSISVDSSFYYRSIIASKNGITNYTGTADQNIKLLTLLKQGELIK